MILQAAGLAALAALSPTALLVVVARLMHLTGNFRPI